MIVVTVLVPLLMLVSIPVGAQQKPETFQDAKLRVIEGDSIKQIDVALTYDTEALVIVEKHSGKPVKSFAYTDVKSAEYSYGKSPRWKTAIFVSPLFLFTSGKKHWFMVQAGGDYGVMQLDKSNYKMVLAAFETKTGKKVEIVADNK